MQFLSPSWLYAIIFPIILVIVAGFLYRKYNQRWNAFVSDPRLADRLIERDSPATWWISTALIFLSLVLLFIALADPVNGKKQLDIPTKGKQIYLAVDLSRSMLVEDIAPNRLTKAKTLAIEIIEAFPDEKIGVISFAGKAWLEAPLTTDHTVLQEALLSMNEKSIPYGGSDSAPLFDLMQGLQNEDEEYSEALLVILSDGEFHSPPSQSDLRKTRDAGFTIYTIGVGTSSGGIVPDERQRDGYFRDRSGRTVNSTLKTEPLEKIALFGNGEAFLDRNYDFVPRLKNAISTLTGETTNTKTLVTYNHLYQYFLTPALILLFLACFTSKLWKLMKHVLPILLLGFCLMPQELSAEGTPVALQSGKQLLEDEQYDEAIANLEEKLPDSKGENTKKLNFSKGTAEYKTENFRKAIESFSNSLLSEDPTLQTESHYNLGNTIFKNGEEKLSKIAEKKKLNEIIELHESVMTDWKSSLGHYRGSLHLTPEHTNARENYDYVKKRLDELEEEQKELMELLQKMQGQEKGKGEPGEGEPGGEGEGAAPKDLTPEELKKIAEEEQGGGSDGDRPESGGEEEDQDAEGQPGGDEEGERGYGEAEKEDAREKLKEGSDFESGNLRTNRQRFFSQPSKDW